MAFHTDGVQFEMVRDSLQHCGEMPPAAQTGKGIGARNRAGIPEECWPVIGWERLLLGVQNPVPNR
jgi:hypothetical protein